MLAAKEPFESRETIVEAPLASEAVVRALAITLPCHVRAVTVPTPVMPVYEPDMRAVPTVPAVKFDAFIDVMDVPPPLYRHLQRWRQKTR